MCCPPVEGSTPCRYRSARPLWPSRFPLTSPAVGVTLEIRADCFPRYRTHLTYAMLGNISSTQQTKRAGSGVWGRIYSPVWKSRFRQLVIFKNKPSELALYDHRTKFAAFSFRPQSINQTWTCHIWKQRIATVPQCASANRTSYLQQRQYRVKLFTFNT